MSDKGLKPLGPTSSLFPSPLFPLVRAVKGVEGVGRKQGSIRWPGHRLPWTYAQPMSAG